MISDYLSKQERFACVKVGALSFAGRLDAERGPLDGVKTAGVLDAAAKGTAAAKTVWLLAALSAGVPLGILAHVGGRRVSGNRIREEELREKIRLYRDAADEMAGGLPAGAGY